MTAHPHFSWSQKVKLWFFPHFEWVISVFTLNVFLFEIKQSVIKQYQSTFQYLKNGCMCECGSVCVHAYMYVSVCLQAYIVCVHVCTCMHMCVCVCVCVCETVCVWVCGERVRDEVTEPHKAEAQKCIIKQNIFIVILFKPKKKKKKIKFLPLKYTRKKMHKAKYRMTQWTVKGSRFILKLRWHMTDSLLCLYTEIPHPALIQLQFLDKQSGLLKKIHGQY